MTRSFLEQSSVGFGVAQGNLIPDDTLDTVPIPKVEISAINGFETGQKIRKAIEILGEAAEDNGIIYSDGTRQLGPSDGDHFVFEPNPADGAEDLSTITVLLIAPSKDTCLRFHADSQGNSLEFQLDKESLSPGIPPRRVAFSGSDGAELPAEATKPTQFFTDTFVGVVNGFRDKRLISTDIAKDVFKPLEDLEAPKESTLSQRVRSSLGRAAEWLGFSIRSEAV